MGQGVGRAWPWPLEPQTLSLLLGSVQKGLRERGSSSASPSQPISLDRAPGHLCSL